MKTLMGIILVLAFGTILAGCNDYRYKHHGKGYHGGHHGKYHKGKHGNRLPGDRGRRAPNCAADGPGCRQFNPNK